MKTLQAMQVRRNFGAVLDEVRITAEPVLLQRAGKPIAMICPLPSTPPPGTDAKLQRTQDAIKRLAGLGRSQPRAADLQAWLRTERDDWR